VECPLFYNAIKKYGFENFKSEIVADGLTLDEANWLEKYLIAYYHSAERKYGYNLSHGGDGILGYSSPEKNAKISKAKMGTHLPREVYERIAEKRRGTKMPKAAVDKTAAWHRGRKRSKSTCANIANALHDFYKSEEGMLMAKARVHNRRRVADENGVIYDSIKEAAEILMIEPSTLRKAIGAGRYTHGVLLKFV
jgi:group I intron endonuclease